MKNKYIDLIEQTFEFPQDEFSVQDNELNFHDIPLMDIIKQYGTPLKVTYLPKITSQIQRAKRLFNVAMAKVDYRVLITIATARKVRISHSYWKRRSRTISTSRPLRLTTSTSSTHCTTAGLSTKISTSSATGSNGRNMSKI